MKRTGLSLYSMMPLLIAFTMSGVAHADRTDDDIHFMKKAASAGRFEIQAGDLARQRSSDDDVRLFANNMIDGYARISMELLDLARERGIELPTRLGDRHQRTLDRLSNADAGSDFDDTYIDIMIDNHQKTITLFEAAAEGADAEEIREFAQNALPRLKQYRQGARKLDEREVTP